MELKPNMYVRTLKGIAKIIDRKLDPKDYYFQCWVTDRFLCICDDTEYLCDSDILKASYNLIDLIEVGDILLIKDFVDEACMIFNDMYCIQNENQLFNIKRDLEKNKNMKISKILTKEQDENNVYRIGE